jgi:hypothetical protein
MGRRSVVEGAARLIELAEHCEKATGTDRSLDRDIAIATFVGHEDGGCLSRARKVILSHGARPENYEIVAISGVSLRTPEYFTRSLDAAITLVPEGIGGELLSIMLHRSWRGDCSVKLLDTLGGQESVGKAATPALALCAASLRARAGAPS